MPEPLSDIEDGGNNTTAPNKVICKSQQPKNMLNKRYLKSDKDAKVIKRIAYSKEILFAIRSRMMHSGNYYPPNFAVSNLPIKILNEEGVTSLLAVETKVNSCDSNETEQQEENVRNEDNDLTEAAPLLSWELAGSPNKSVIHPCSDHDLIRMPVISTEVTNRVPHQLTTSDYIYERSRDRDQGRSRGRGRGRGRGDGHEKRSHFGPSTNPLVRIKSPPALSPWTKSVDKKVHHVPVYCSLTSPSWTPVQPDSKSSFISKLEMRFRLAVAETTRYIPTD